MNHHGQSNDATSRSPAMISRRDFGRILAAGIPGSLALANLPVSASAKINSRINGVLIGAITYSFRAMAAADIVRAYVTIGLGEM